jgi:hypothetical protein
VTTDVALSVGPDDASSSAARPAPVRTVAPGRPSRALVLRRLDRRADVAARARLRRLLLS